MPELPDVEVFRRYIHATSLGQKVAAVHAPSPELLRDVSPQALGRALKGRALADTKRHGKFMAAVAEGGGCLVLHYGMTGFPRYFKRGDKEPEHVRLRLDFENGASLAYDCSRKLGQVLWEREFKNLVRRKGLGPDALRLDYEGFRKLMQGRKGSVKTALMRQEVMAGIGNVYSDEILFQAGMHPKTSLPDLDNSTLRNLHETMHTVLKTAIEKDAQPENLPRNWLLYAKSQGWEQCPVCNGGLEKLKAGGRSAHFCPACQKHR